MRDVVVVDVGARGRFHPRWDRLGDRLHAIAFDGDVHAGIQMPRGGGRVLRKALGEEPGVVPWMRTREPGCSSTYEPNSVFLRRFADAEFFDVMERRQVEVETLDRLLEDAPHFMKLDVQGAELGILRGAATLLPGVIGLEVEVEFAPLYKDAPLFGEVDTFLRGNGFELCDLNRHYWRDLADGQMRCIFADALYFKRPELVDEPEIAKTLRDCYGLSLRQTLAHAFQWGKRYFGAGAYDSDMQLGW